MLRGSLTESDWVWLITLNDRKGELKLLKWIKVIFAGLIAPCHLTICRQCEDSSLQSLCNSWSCWILDPSPQWPWSFSWPLPCLLTPSCPGPFLSISAALWFGMSWAGLLVDLQVYEALGWHLCSHSHIHVTLVCGSRRCAELYISWLVRLICTFLNS